MHADHCAPDQDQAVALDAGEIADDMLLGGIEFIDHHRDTSGDGVAEPIDDSFDQRAGGRQGQAVLHGAMNCFDRAEGVSAPRYDQPLAKGEPQAADIVGLLAEIAMKIGDDAEDDIVLGVKAELFLGHQERSPCGLGQDFELADPGTCPLIRQGEMEPQPAIFGGKCRGNTIGLQGFGRVALPKTIRPDQPGHTSGRAIAARQAGSLVGRKIHALPPLGRPRASIGAQATR